MKRKRERIQVSCRVDPAMLECLQTETLIRDTTIQALVTEALKAFYKTPRNKSYPPIDLTQVAERQSRDLFMLYCRSMPRIKVKFLLEHMRMILESPTAGPPAAVRVSPTPKDS